MLESGNIDEPLIIFAVPQGILEDDITQVQLRLLTPEKLRETVLLIQNLTQPQTSSTTNNFILLFWVSHITFTIYNEFEINSNYFEIMYM